MSMKPSEIRILMLSIAPVIREYVEQQIREATAPRDAEIAALKAEVAILERRDAIDLQYRLDERKGWVLTIEQPHARKEIQTGHPFHCGPWRDGATYAYGAEVQYDGGTWRATATTSETPGEGKTAWVLVSRRGKQGKEGRPGRDLR